MSKRPTSDPNAESRDDPGNFAFAPAESEEPALRPELDADSILSIADTGRRPAVVGSDPYNRTSAKPVEPPGKNKKRSLDDMRELSKAIKDAPTWAPPDKKLAQRVAELSAELELVLAELAALSSAAPDPADRRDSELKKQLVCAANHLEEVLDCLVPSDPPA